MFADEQRADAFFRPQPIGPILCPTRFCDRLAQRKAGKNGVRVRDVGQAASEPAQPVAGRRWRWRCRNRGFCSARFFPAPALLMPLFLLILALFRWQFLELFVLFRPCCALLAFSLAHSVSWLWKRCCSLARAWDSAGRRSGKRRVGQSRAAGRTQQRWAPRPPLGRLEFRPGWRLGFGEELREPETQNKPKGNYRCEPFSHARRKSLSMNAWTGRSLASRKASTSSASCSLSCQYADAEGQQRRHERRLQSSGRWLKLNRATQPPSLAPARGGARAPAILV